MRMYGLKFQDGNRTEGQASHCFTLLSRFMALPASEGGSREAGRKQVAAKSTRDTSLSNIRRRVRKEFLKAILASKDAICDDPEKLPSLDSAYMEFINMFPRFLETKGVDNMRADEYAHLQSRTCLDYSGFGLFSHLQRVCNSPSSTFRLAYVSANLPTHALYGVAEESSLEGYIRRRIMEYFRLSENDYCMVFTASKGCAVKLLAESYRFDMSGRLVTAYDHRSQSIEWMMECARQKGAKVSSGRFRWPSLRICSKDLKKLLVDKKVKKNSPTKGLFVFPYQSRVTGVRYSYQWIPLAQQNRWHVLLDASALGPRDMDALGLSVFGPDFIVSSFYKVFGADPSGFGCLFIKKSSISCLYNSSKARAVGMVKLLPCMDETQGEEQNGLQAQEDLGGVKSEFDPSIVSSFSGPLSAEQLDIVREMHTEDLTTPTICDNNRLGALFDRTIEESASAVKTATRSSSHSAEEVEERGGEEPSVEMSVPVVETSTITLLYPTDSEPVVDTRVDVKGKRKLEEFDIGESSNTRKSETGDMHAGPSTKVFTLRELLSIPESELASQSLGSEKTRELLATRVVCKALDQTKLLGMTKIRKRLRYLISWLVLSLSNLRHPASSSDTSLKQPLVHVYGPSMKYDRGASVAFNLYDWDGTLLQPALVQRLADRNRISLGLAEIKNVEIVASDIQQSVSSTGGRKSSCSATSVCSSSEFLAITIALSYVSNFEDVYRLWEFVAKFLDADFVNKEVWRYHSLNQEIVVLGSNKS